MPLSPPLHLPPQRHQAFARGDALSPHITDAHGHRYIQMGVRLLMPRLKHGLGAGPDTQTDPFWEEEGVVGIRPLLSPTDHCRPPPTQEGRLSSFASPRECQPPCDTGHQSPLLPGSSPQCHSATVPQCPPHTPRTRVRCAIRPRSRPETRRGANVGLQMSWSLPGHDPPLGSDASGTLGWT